MQNTMLDSTISSNSQELPNASSAIKLFENPLFKVRVIMRCSDPWFVAKDVATCIEHKDVTTMCRVCRDKDKVTITDSKEIGVINESLITQQTFSKNTPNVVLISESGLYRILAKCNLPKCEPWFVAKDACDCLELTNVSKACQTLDDDEKGVGKTDTLGG